jgi:NAD(P)-dependent dehydrogenase (short-subunit alcohol dehydrogenase family)
VEAFRDHSARVTGGSRGIGAAICQALNEGGNVEAALKGETR